MAAVRGLLLVLLLGGAAVAHFAPWPWPGGRVLDAILFTVIALDWAWLRLLKPAAARRAQGAG